MSAATSATVRKATAARGAGTGAGRPTGMAAGWAAGTGREYEAAEVGRPIGRGAGTPGREVCTVARWGMVTSINSGISTNRATGFPTGGRDTHVLEKTIWGPEGRKRWGKRTGGPVP